MESSQKRLLQCPSGSDGALGEVEKPRLGVSFQGQRELVGHHDHDHRNNGVQLQEVPGVGGAIVAEDVDLELLGPGGLAELGREG